MAWVSTRIICFQSGEINVYSHGKDRDFEEMAIKASKRNPLLLPSVELVNMHILCSLLPLHYTILDYSSAKLEFVIAICFKSTVRLWVFIPSTLLCSVFSHANQTRLRRPLTPCLTSSSPISFSFIRPDPPPELFPKLFFFAVSILITQSLLSGRAVLPRRAEGKP